MSYYSSFKKFLNEDIGLGNIGKSIDNLFNNKDYNRLAGSYNNADFLKSPEGYSGDIKLPSNDLTIPKVEKTGIITILLLKQNPIFIQLSKDGKVIEELYFTYDEFKRIHGVKPELKKTMTVVFQRNPTDNDNGNKSKIDYAIVS